jgi:hypothetical protein
VFAAAAALRTLCASRGSQLHHPSEHEPLIHDPSAPPNLLKFFHTNIALSQIPKLLKPPDVDLPELKRRIHDPEVRMGLQPILWGRIW